MRPEPKVQIGCAYEGDFGRQLCAARRLPPGPPLHVPRERPLLDALIGIGLVLLGVKNVTNSRPE